MARGRIAVMSGGGDCPGTNAVIRAVAKKAIIEHGLEVTGVLDGYEGLIRNRHRKLHYEDVSGIITLGGTILGTSNTANPYSYSASRGPRARFRDVSATVLANYERLDVDCLAVIGGDGTLSIASRLAHDGLPVVGIPKTIDNDLRGTELTFGFNTAVSIATDGIDRLHSTAQSHHRVMVVEVMGRNAGWIALHSGIAGGGDILLIPEIPYDIKCVVDKVRERARRGKRFTIVVVAEGAKPRGGDVVVSRRVKDSAAPVRLGGVGLTVGSQIEELTGVETRTVVMGHLLRGGTPTAFDRVLATRLGTRALDMIAAGRCGMMVGVKGDSLVEVPLDEVAGGPRLVPADHALVASARAVGTSFGDD